MTNGYNGWTNRETWLVNLWYGEYFEEVSMEREVNPQLIRDELEDLLSHVFEGMCGGFIRDMINLSCIDYEELANHYNKVED